MAEFETLDGINAITEKWINMTKIVLDLNKITHEQIKCLINETRILLNDYQNDALVPKETIKLFLEMEDFLYFSSLMEEKEVGADFYHYTESYNSIKQLKEDFLKD